MNPGAIDLTTKDATAAGLAHGDLARVRGPGGEVVLPVRVTSDDHDGAVVLSAASLQRAMGQHGHHGPRRGLVRSALLRNTVPDSPQSCTGVSVSRYPADWYGLAVCLEQPAASGAAYARTTPLPAGWQIELASSSPTDFPELARLLLGTGADVADTLTHEDADLGLYRTMAFIDDRLAMALIVDRQPLAIARDWLAARLGTPLDPGERFRLLDGRPGGALQPRGRLVCICCDISALEVGGAIASGAADLAAIGHATRAGTNCGRCRPEISRMLVNGVKPMLT